MLKQRQSFSATVTRKGEIGDASAGGQGSARSRKIFADFRSDLGSRQKIGMR